MPIGTMRGDGKAENPCVRRFRHRRLCSWLWLQGLQATAESYVRPFLVRHLLIRLLFFSKLMTMMFASLVADPKNDGVWSHASARRAGCSTSRTPSSTCGGCGDSWWEAGGPTPCATSPASCRRRTPGGRSAPRPWPSASSSARTGPWPTSSPAKMEAPPCTASTSATTGPSATAPSGSAPSCSTCSALGSKSGMCMHAAEKIQI